MRVRARHIHALEGFVDNVIGLVINFFAIILIYNGMLGHEISYSDNLVGASIMFFISWVRKYTVRRWFSAIIQKVYKKYELQEQTGKV